MGTTQKHTSEPTNPPDFEVRFKPLGPLGPPKLGRVIGETPNQFPYVGLVHSIRQLTCAAKSVDDGCCVIFLKMIPYSFIISSYIPRGSENFRQETHTHQTENQ